MSFILTISKTGDLYYDDSSYDVIDGFMYLFHLQTIDFIVK